MTIIRRFECALVKTKDRTQEIAKIFGEGCPDEVLFKETGVGYFNLSDFTLKHCLMSRITWLKISGHILISFRKCKKRFCRAWSLINRLQRWQKAIDYLQ